MGKFSGLKGHVLTLSASAASGPCLAEASWIIQGPEFEASNRLRALLLYIAEKSDQSAAKISQKDIARDVMGLGLNYDPSCDAHVRIEVKRLRAALDGFYSRLKRTRTRRLSVPKGGYRTVLDALPMQDLRMRGSFDTGDPIMALGTLCAVDHLSCGYGFEIECEVLTLISQSEFLSDGLLSFTCVEGKTLDALADQAERQGACVLLVTRVMATDEVCNAYLSVIDPRSRQIISNTRLSPRSDGVDRRMIVDSVSKAVTVLALDPIGGRVVNQVSELLPQSRIARLADAFSFMATQDRERLPAAMSSVKTVVQSSSVAKALSIDMSRASFCFSTDPDIKEISFIEDAAEALIEDRPESIWSALALGYAGVTGCRQDLIGSAVNRVKTMQPVGSQIDDVNLLKTLSALDPSPNGRSDKQNANPSVFESIRVGMAALHDPTDAFSNEALHASPHRDVFWIQAFQISTLVEKGKKSEARAVFERMRHVNPNVEDYMHRALSTMLPDANLQSKANAGLKTVVC
ncbi:hypothetical protein [Sedimentitalea todarodis]|uniref:Bacterial transcriptional activator domain-containing protein n=1 Tax=Sedimentitalea todarodis TaxID=1631240 RepID=A0ABU3VL05_9RHOB|nr:hypothetical protein [Sedimentitalea todarodis]MDU9006856.1 hypothetical protein [Sedimentitalea todarodis]